MDHRATDSVPVRPLSAQSIARPSVRTVRGSAIDRHVWAIRSCPDAGATRPDGTRAAPPEAATSAAVPPCRAAVQDEHGAGQRQDRPG
ncbi:hypothetical protein Arub01_19850 [Actinomadura rubrobrunea]|uniref:Uncharacterized protein n=1 Tax=Actinomadura rubrobrunea TaxID=115335 RepID=A0A9W6PVG9_9ACTN|nr:hypothetical protein Arub01_19850 [Actinomadura rubrobrunea]